MNIKNRIKKLETASSLKKNDDAKYGITFDEWRLLSSGEDIYAGIPKNRRDAFDEWQKRAAIRRSEAAQTMSLYAD